MNPADISEKAKNIVLNLLPLKSREQYEKEYDLFCEWKTEKGVVVVNEEVILTYLHEKDKVLLNKPGEWRTEQDKALLFKFLCDLKSFRKYPEEVIAQLTSKIYFTYYGPNRTIVKKGRKVNSVYYVLNGEVQKYETKFDERLNEEVNVNSTILRHGDCFGDISAMHNTPRVNSVDTISHCEFLVLDVEDFNETLRPYLLKQWQEGISALSCFSYFDGLEDSAIHDFCIIAKMKTFKKDQTILSEGEGLKTFAHFIVSGRCAVIEHLLIREKIKNGVLRQTFFSLEEERQCNIIKKNQSETMFINIMKRESLFIDAYSAHEARRDFNNEYMYEPPKDVSTYFIQVCTYSDEAVFGIGENLSRRTIVALTDMQILLVPIAWLHLRANSNLWKMVQNYLNRTIPSSEEVFEIFKSHRKFSRFSKKYVESLYQKCPVNTVHNVPYSIRIHSDFDYEQKRKKYYDSKNEQN